MSTVRELRGLVPLEIACVLAIAVIPWPEALPVGILLLVVASLSRWLRGRRWGELLGGGADRVVVGAVAGAIAIGVVSSIGGSLDGSLPVVVRGGDVGLVALVLVVLVASAVAMELALRGWIVERMLELSPGPAILPILTGALAEALVTPGPVASRLGAALFGVGLGALHVASGRRVLVPIAARCAFVTGAVLLAVVGS